MFSEFQYQELQSGCQQSDRLMVDLQKTQQELKETKDKLSFLLEHHPLGIIQWNTAFEVSSWNPAAKDIFGYSQQEALNRHAVELIVPHTARENITQLRAELIKQDQGTRCIHENCHKDGTIITCEWHHTPVTDFRGNVTGILSIVQDITKRTNTYITAPKQAEIALKKSLKEIADIKFALDQSSIVAVTNNQGIIEYVNDKFCQISQYQPEELIGKTHRIINSGYHSKEFFQEMWLTISQGSVWKGEVKNLAKDGTYYWVDTTIVPLLDEQGKPQQYVAIRNDITARKQAEITLKQSLKEIADIKFALDQSSIVAVTNHQGIIEYVNDKFCQISQYQPEELISKTHRIINSAYHSKEFFQEMWLTISQGSVWKGEVKNLAKDGTYYWVDTTIVPLLDEQGKPQQYVAIRNDITARKQAEAELSKQAKELEQALKQLQLTQLQLIQSEKMSSLGQLVAGVAHEINNPVNFIFANLQHAYQYTQNLLKMIHLYQNYYPEPALEIAKEAEHIDLEFLLADLPKLYSSMTLGATRISQIVTSLRTFSRLDESDLKAGDIHEGIDSALMILEHRLKSQENRPDILVIREYGNLPLVECYAAQLNQALMNILINAIDALDEKYEQESYQQVTPTIHICTEMSSYQQITIRIKDNGVGMSDDVRQKIFDPFYTSKPVGKGIGMGLSISYQIITNRHGGSLECTSSLGKGAEFMIAIPIHPMRNTQKSHPHQELG
ncbi:PAS domain-containing sensor histidine kinase [Nostoc parmelioides]|uniref:histidine kinase n=1 Tax=Nostoc parmelioides FACHB-3921 TaxID=2692909 RepID=A0ABR8BA60_9NOSO|nr:PAS domain S-box protein [Nostoc parmelioides]MBD2249893.1 PAS domain-containing sensor histidine kinase [Nostoc parmelioides FACHB-3921]